MDLIKQAQKIEQTIRDVHIGGDYPNSLEKRFPNIKFSVELIERELKVKYIQGVSISVESKTRAESFSVLMSFLSANANCCISFSYKDAPITFTPVNEEVVNEYMAYIVEELVHKSLEIAQLLTF